MLNLASADIADKLAFALAGVSAFSQKDNARLLRSNPKQVSQLRLCLVWRSTHGKQYVTTKQERTIMEPGPRCPAIVLLWLMEYPTQPRSKSVQANVARTVDCLNRSAAKNQLKTIQIQDYL
jgi:hypothetical protein